MTSNEACLKTHQSPSFFRAYKGRFFLYVGVALTAYGALGLPESRFASMLGGGALQYLTQTVPLALFMAVFYIFSDARVREKTFGLRDDTLTWVLAGLGACMIAWGFYEPSTFWGRTGFTVIYWGGDLRCMREECAYWKAWKQRRRDRK